MEGEGPPGIRSMTFGSPNTVWSSTASSGSKCRRTRRGVSNNRVNFHFTSLIIFLDRQLCTAFFNGRYDAIQVDPQTIRYR